MGHPAEHLTEVGGGLDGVASCGKCGCYLTVVCERYAQAHQGHRLVNFVVGLVAFARHLVELGYCGNEIALQKMCPPEPGPGQSGVRPVTDRVGKIASLLARRARGYRITGGHPGIGLPGKYLAQHPLVVQGPGHLDRLRVEGRCRLDVVAGTGDVTACGERPGEQRRVVEFAGDLDRTSCALQLLVADIYVEDGLVGKSTRAHRRCDRRVFALRRYDVEPGEALQNPAPRQPDRLQR